MKQVIFLQYWLTKTYFSHHNRVLVAVSGGLDSMSLLYLLYTYRDVLEIELAIAHVNHGQREASQLEEDYLRQWAKQRQLPIYINHFTGQFSEARARDFRYQFFAEIMQKENFTALVTAHHADDQAETILMRLIRGGRLKHLSAIKDRQPFHSGELIRPFLSFFKSDLPATFHFEDQTNAEMFYFRNRIRHQYLKQLEKENAKVKQHLIHLGREVDQVYEALNELSKALDVRDVPSFLQQTSAVQHYLLEKYLLQFPQLQVTRSQFEQLLLILRTKKSYYSYFKQGYYIKKDRIHFELTRISPQTDSQTLLNVLEYKNRSYVSDYSFFFGETSDCHNYDQSIVLTSHHPITIRSRQAGDYIHVRGIRKKLRRFFIDEKISHTARQKTIIIEQNQEILAVLCQGSIYLSNPSNHGIIKAVLYIQKMKNGESC